MIVWKIVFVIFLLIVIIGVAGDLSHIQIWHFFDLLSDIGIVVALIGMFSFVFKKVILPTGFWGVFFWIYLLFNVYNLLLYIIPTSLFKFPDQLIGYDTHLNIGGPNITVIILLLVIEIPMLYTNYQLSKAN